MIKLNSTQQNVRSFLIDMIRNPLYIDNAISYLKLINACDLGFSLAKPNDRTALGDLLCAICEYEYERGRPLLSAVVVQENTGLPGDKFFGIADKLGVRKEKISHHPMLADDKKFSNVMIADCHTYWKNDENYNAFAEILESDKE